MKSDLASIAATMRELLERPAHHEAAHAVVALRLRLWCDDTDSTDIIQREVGSNTTFGQTNVKAADGNPEEGAIVAAAGIASDDKRSTQFWDVPANAPTASDVEKLAYYAHRLGVLGRAEDFRQDPAFGPWATEKVQRAHGWLHDDRAAAWEHVEDALLQRTSLSGYEVRALVAEADKESGYRPQSL